MIALVHKGKIKKRTKTTDSSIVPYVDGAPTRMCFPPSQCLETITKKKDPSIKSLENTNNKKGKGSNSQSVGSKRSRAGPNVSVKVGKGKKKKGAENVPVVPPDSPAMCTRSKFLNPASPAMSTRSKRRLSL